MWKLQQGYPDRWAERIYRKAGWWFGSESWSRWDGVDGRDEGSTRVD
jgi:hypothetical protein